MASISNLVSSVILQASEGASDGIPDPRETAMAVDLTVWKWVIIIGVAAIVILYAVKRLADVAVKKKTANMIREVVGEDDTTDSGEDLEDLEKLDKELD